MSEQTREDRVPSLVRTAKSILRAAAIDLTGKALKYVGLGALALVGLLVWKGGSVPTWSAFLAVVVVAGCGVFFVRKAGRSSHDEDGALVRYATYSDHVAEVLNALQRVVAGDIEVSTGDYIEKGILSPARDVLTEKPAENVRLSILLPRQDDPTRWSMAWAAGHSLEGKAKYRELIAGTLSRHAYEGGGAQYWGDVTTQSDFRPNPKASSPIRAMISLPIQAGDRVLGVFNVVSSEPDAFDNAEETYVTTLARVIAVAVGVGFKEEIAKSE
jgi:GAF domain-containing protein